MMPTRFDCSPIPYGVTDFETIRREHYYYVDKTMFIPQLEFDARFAFFLRPRRFGKSLLLNMLANYYDIRPKYCFDDIFKGLYIHEHPTTEQGKYLILKFNFSEVNSDPGQVQESFNWSCLSAIKAFVRKYEAFLPSDTMECINQVDSCDKAMNKVCQKAQDAGRSIYLMIDEYDNFANTIMSHNEGAYQSLTHGDGFFRFFFNCLKAYTTDNSAAVQHIFITGVSPLTLSDVTSGFNIGLNLSMMAKYNGLAGLSETDVRQMLDYYRGHTGVFRHTNDEILSIIKPWYNNYCFSRSALSHDRMFNTDMVLYFMTHYISEGNSPENMIDPNVKSDYRKMQQLIRFEKTYGQKTQMLQGIVANGQVSTPVNPEFSLSDMDAPRNLYSLLYYLGFLTFSGEFRGQTVLSVPNEVMKIQYSEYLLKMYQSTLGLHDTAIKMEQLMLGLAWDGEWKPFFEFVAASLQEVSSVRDYIDGESFVKAFFLANIAMDRENSFYDFPSEQEYGKGYVDLILSPRGPVKDMYLVELKYAKKEATGNDIEKLFDEACDQLEQYTTGPDFQTVIKQRGWRYHKIVIVMHTWDMVRCELVGE